MPSTNCRKQYYDNVLTLVTVKIFHKNNVSGERHRAAPRQVRAAQWRRAFPEDRTGAATAFHSPAATS